MSTDHDAVLPFSAFDAGAASDAAAPPRVDAGARRLTSRSRWAGWSTAVGGLLLAVPSFVGGHGGDDLAGRLRFEAAHQGSETAKWLLFQAAALLLLPGVVSITGRVRGRGTVPVVMGGVTFAAGLVGLFGFAIVAGLEVALAADGSTGPQAATVAAADRLGNAIVAVPTFVLGLLCFHTGLPWLCWGTVRARLMPWWTAVAATAGSLAAFVGSGTVAESVGVAVMGAAAVHLGWAATGAMTAVTPGTPS